MTTEKNKSDIPFLIGQRIFHTAPGFGPGAITKAFLYDNSDIFVQIAFDNNRSAKPFSLANCVSNGLIEFKKPEVIPYILNHYTGVKGKLLSIAKTKEDKLRQEEAIRIEAERSRLRLEQKQLEDERKRLEEERKAKERIAAKQAELERQEQEKRDIYYYLTEERGVQFLVHFTPVSNLPSILSKGIMPRSTLSEEGIHADTPDVERFDCQMGCSSFSISFPNYRVFYNKRMTTPYTYAVLIIDPQLIKDLPFSAVSYLPVNAASKSYIIGSLFNEKEYLGLKAVQALFSEKVQIGTSFYSREQLHLPESFTTNPQAEVFIQSTVSPKYIRSIIAENPNKANQIKALLQSSSVHIPKIIINKDFYKPRIDWPFWSAQSDTSKD